MRRDVSPRGKLPCCRADHMLFRKQEDDSMKRYISLVALMAAFATPAAAQSVAPAPGAVAPAPLLVPMTAEGFRAMALQSDAFEISSSQLALQRSRNPAVRSFARQMVQDHSMT